MLSPKIGLCDTARKVGCRVPNNMGCSLLPSCFFQMGVKLEVIDNCPLTGDGYQAFKTARAHGQPVILVAGHIGNYDAIRGKLVRGKAIQLAACINQ